MKTRYKILAGVLSLTLTLLILFVSSEPPQVVEAGAQTGVRNLCGTGTTTAGTINFGATPATTTCSLIVGGDIDTIDFDVYPESASSTNHLNLQVLKTSLDRCGVTGGVKQDWIDAISTNSVSTHLTSLTTATGTVAMTFPASTELGKKFQLTNFNARCLKVFVGGQNVNVYIQANLKTLTQ